MGGQSDYFSGVHPSQKKPPARSGPATGARIAILLYERPHCSGELAQKLGLDESYIRRTCRVLCKMGVLQLNRVSQTGTPPVRFYSIKEPPHAEPPAVSR